MSVPSSTPSKPCHVIRPAFPHLLTEWRDPKGLESHKMEGAWVSQEGPKMARRSEEGWPTLAFTVVGGRTRVRVPTRGPGFVRLDSPTGVKEGNMWTFSPARPVVEKKGAG